MRPAAMATLLLAGTMLGGATMAACALVEDLNGSEYTQVQAEGGAEAGCAGKSNCIPLVCLSTADCGDAGDVCAITAGFFTLATLSCMTPDQFESSQLAVQLCITDSDCLNGHACSPQTCAILGVDGGEAIGVSACGLISGCH